MRSSFSLNYFWKSWEFITKTSVSYQGNSRSVIDTTYEIQFIGSINLYHINWIFFFFGLAFLGLAIRCHLLLFRIFGMGGRELTTLCEGVQDLDLSSFLVLSRICWRRLWDLWDLLFFSGSTVWRWPCILLVGFRQVIFRRLMSVITLIIWIWCLWRRFTVAQEQFHTFFWRQLAFYRRVLRRVEFWRRFEDFWLWLLRWRRNRVFWRECCWGIFLFRSFYCII